MKKLFFAAIMATVAVSGAFAQSGAFHSFQNFGLPDIICDGGEIMCSQIYSGPAYKFTPPDQFDLIPLSMYRYTDGVMD